MKNVFDDIAAFANKYGSLKPSRMSPKERAKQRARQCWIVAVASAVLSLSLYFSGARHILAGDSGWGWGLFVAGLFAQILALTTARNGERWDALKKGPNDHLRG